MAINKASHLVFDYFADFTKDPQWRKEINKTETSSRPIGVGTTIIENSFLSGKVPNYISTLTCTALDPGKLIISESVPTNMFWAKSTREVEHVTDNTCTITYRLQFDMDIVKHGLGIALPKFFVTFYTKQTMKKYMKQLKKNLESN